MIGILGNGSWATAIAKILTDNGHDIIWWMRNEKAVQNLKTKRQNFPYLSSIVFNRAFISPTTDLQYLLKECSTIIFCVPSAYLIHILHQIGKNDLHGKTIVSAVKGILPDEYLLLHDYLLQHHELDREKYVSITGPCHAEEVAQERLSYLTFSSEDLSLAEKIAALFRNEYMNTTESTDIEGTQYASVLKNIYAIGAGMTHGLGYGDNFLSVYVTNCYKELNEFVKSSFSVLSEDRHTSAYLGDLLVTCYSLHSRNRRFGSLIGSGYSIKSSIAEMGMMAEGYYASKGMHHVLEKRGKKLPLLEIIYSILWEEEPPAVAFEMIEKLLQ